MATVFFTIRSKRRGGRCVFAVVAESLLRDVRYALQFAFGSSEIARPSSPDIVGRYQIKQIHHCFERIVDFVRDGCCHAPCRCQFLRLQEGLFQTFGVGNVSQNLGGTDDSSLSIPEW